MPIHFPIALKSLTAEEFDKIDFRVMGHAFASQNCLGRLCEESAYQLDLEARLQGNAGRSADFAEGVRAFQEKRAPRFGG